MEYRAIHPLVTKKADLKHKPAIGTMSGVSEDVDGRMAVDYIRSGYKRSFNLMALGIRNKSRMDAIHLVFVLTYLVCRGKTKRQS